MHIELPEPKIDFEIKIPDKKYTLTAYHSVLPRIGDTLKILYYNNNYDHIEKIVIVTNIVHELNCGHEGEMNWSSIVIETKIGES